MYGIVFRISLSHFPPSISLFSPLEIVPLGGAFFQIVLNVLMVRPRCDLLKVPSL